MFFHDTFMKYETICIFLNAKRWTYLSCTCIGSSRGLLQSTKRNYEFLLKMDFLVHLKCYEYVISHCLPTKDDFKSPNTERPGGPNLARVFF
jgi:hypothetical protein